MAIWDEDRETKFALAAATKAGQLDEIFRGLAEYDTFGIQQHGGFEAWAAKHDIDPKDPDAEELWDSLHTVWMIAWDFFGWDEFQRRLAIARDQLN